MPQLPDELQPLAILGTARLPADEYFGPLLDSPNELLRIGAWCVLLDRDEVPASRYADAVLLSVHGGVRRRAVQHFQRFFEYGFANQVLALTAADEADAETAVMRAELADDDPALATALVAQFIATGDIDLLAKLMTTRERLGGWRAALPIAVDRVVLGPHDPVAAYALLNLIHSARRLELLEAVVGLFDANHLHPFHTRLFGAAAKLLKGNPGGCLKDLASLGTARPPRADIVGRLRATWLTLNAEALERLGDYRNAYTGYVELNRLEQKTFDLAEFGKTTLAAAALAVPPLPSDARADCFIMTGFPRSGTTLLENALAAHPLVETFEEIPSSTSMQLFLDLTLPELPASADLVPVFEEARARYYAEIDRRRKKPAATALVDKLPIKSADAVFTAKLFPEKRYIFSIRHPFDVVLSCFKQQFEPNIVMEHFRTFETAAKLYDFTMTQWFATFSLDDPRVHYVRYHTLVTEFEPTVRAALAFLGAPWDDAVLNFAAAAENRAARTPSYQKVRQGLTIGMQSSWKNYGFLFQSDAAKPLRKWVEFFGYHAE